MSNLTAMNRQEWPAYADPRLMLWGLEGRTSDRKLRLFVLAFWRWYDSHPRAGRRKDEHFRRALEIAEGWCDREPTGQEAADAVSQTGDYHLLRHPAIEAARSAVECVPTWLERSPKAEAPGVQAGLLRCVFGNLSRPVLLPWRCRECGIPCGPPAAGYYCVKCGSDAACCPWLTPTVVSLAHAAHDQPLDSGTLDPERLAVLADALEEAGGGEEVCRRCKGKGRISLVIDDDGECQVTATDECSDCKGRKRVPSALVHHLRSPGPHVRGCFALDLLTGRS